MVGTIQHWFEKFTDLFLSKLLKVYYNAVRWIPTHSSAFRMLCMQTFMESEFDHCMRLKKTANIFFSGQLTKNTGYFKEFLILFLHLRRYFWSLWKSWTCWASSSQR